MRVIHNILFGIVLASMVFIAASCCCTGGLDDDSVDLNLPGEHNEGTGGDV